MRRKFVIIASALALSAVPSFAQKKFTDSEVMKVHRSAILIDTHNDVTSRTVDGFDIGKRSADGHTDLPRLKEGGVGATFFAVYVAADFVNGNYSANRTLQMIDTVRHDIVGKYPNDFVLATTAAEIEAAHKKGKFAALLGIEGGHGIEDSVRLLRDFYTLGVRYMTLTHTNTNNWADSSGDIDRPNVKHHNGLTDAGKEIVREMNRLGMMVDISHVSDKTFFDALEVSKAPIFASHSSCRALSNIPRNMTDEMITALAKKGGLVQINFGCDFLSQKSADAAKGLYAAMVPKFAEIRKTKGNDPKAMRAAFEEMGAEVSKKMPPASIADVVAHIDHVVKLAGIDHVGIGSDYDGVFCVPTGLEDVSKYPALTRALLEKGYSAADIRKIYGANMLRLMRAVEKAAGA